MVAEIAAEGGVVDKYIGDAIMAVFGAPLGNEDDAARALRAAAAMHRALHTHNEARAARDLPPLSQGIGVHYGWAIAGNIGTRDRPQYTVIGDTVNLCSRLEGATKETHVSVLASSEVVTAARAQSDDLPPFAPLGTIQVRGRTSPVHVFAVGPEALDEHPDAPE